ncbi:hypothetical protein [Streptomyces sp. NPDC001657]|uniref:hypothetical protein n=1 Tax=Streptomyces sp. NPDC001657 TaxID=3154522 RepID=UPI003318DEDC
MAKENPPFRNLAAVRGAGARARPRTGPPPRAFPAPAGPVRPGTPGGARPRDFP